MKSTMQRKLLVLCTGWIVLSTLGLAWLWSYEVKAGIAAVAPQAWPVDTALVRAAQFPTLLVFVHPKCPCSRATIEELGKLMAHCDDRLTTIVLMLRPDSVPDNWEKTDLWSSAERIPGVIVCADELGRESRRFGVSTSGQVALYSAEGRLLFSGGITESRGHSGDNAGRSAIEALVCGQLATPDAAHTPVFGCELFSSSDAFSVGFETCQK